MNYEDEATKENEKNSVCSVQNKANKVAKPSETTKRQCLDVCPHTHRARGRCRSGFRVECPRVWPPMWRLQHLQHLLRLPHLYPAC